MNKRTSKELLIEAQKALRLNQKDFGTWIGVSARTVNAWMGKAESRSCPIYWAEMALRLAKRDAEAMEAGERTSGMFRWAVIDSDGFTEVLSVYGSKPEAIREAESIWNHFTDREKAKAERFEVGLIHVQLIDARIEKFTYFEDENGQIDSDVYEVAKDYLSK